MEVTFWGWKIPESVAPSLLSDIVRGGSAWRAAQGNPQAETQYIADQRRILAAAVGADKVDWAIRDAEHWRAQLKENNPAFAKVLNDFGAFYLFTSLIMRDVQIHFFPTGSGTQPGLLGRDRSWTYELDGVAVHGGPRNLWRDLEKVHALWEDHGRPDREQLGITITKDQQSLWIGSPNQVVHTDPDAVPAP